MIKSIMATSYATMSAFVYLWHDIFWGYHENERRLANLNVFYGMNVTWPTKLGHIYMYNLAYFKPLTFCNFNVITQNDNTMSLKFLCHAHTSPRMQVKPTEHVKQKQWPRKIPLCLIMCILCRYPCFLQAQSQIIF